ncbi:MAG: hypothetical protein ABSF38_03980 [Verrucomicrobiota bacterium]|jgi:hypothetical protein
MNQEFQILRSDVSRDATDKAGLAERYMVGIRTIEAWQSARIIQGTRQGKRIFYDVEDCDRRLLQFKNPKDNYAHN